MLISITPIIENKIDRNILLDIFSFKNRMLHVVITTMLPELNIGNTIVAGSKVSALIRKKDEKKFVMPMIIPKKTSWDLKGVFLLHSAKSANSNAVKNNMQR